jgi:uncharacterized membrane protein
VLDSILSLTLPQELTVVIIGAMPVAELRLALPVALNLFGFNWYYALFLSVLGNMLPVPVLLLLWKGLSKLLYKIPFMRKPLDRHFKKMRAKSEAIGKYKFWGMLVFVAVPLPFTGAWTAAFVATILGMKFSTAFWSIFGGVFVAGLIVMALSLLGWTGAVIAVIGAVLIAGWNLRSKKEGKVETVR